MNLNKIILTQLLFFTLLSSVIADDDGLPPKGNPNREVDCGAKTATELDRQLEKTGPELTLNRGDNPVGEIKSSFGISGSTTTIGTEISDENLLNLVIGQTKYQDIVALFGKPTSIVRNDSIFFAIYNFTKAETKIDPVRFIPLVGSMLAKNKSNYVQRRVNLRFSPQDGLLISCMKTDRITDPKSQSQLDSTIDTIKKMKVE